VPAQTLALTLAYVGSVFSVMMVLPQLVRTVRNPTMRGVSAMSWALTALASAAWIAYGLRMPLPPQVPGNLLLLCGAAVIVLLVPSPWSRAHRALGLAAAGGATLAVAFVVPTPLVGYLAFGVGLASMWPQVWESVVTNRGATAAGVSLTSFTVKGASQLTWLGYALLAHDLPVTISAVTALVATLVVIAVEAGRRGSVLVEDLRVLEPAS
jgi:uncharacterized protein with PQ loop repeat